MKKPIPSTLRICFISKKFPRDSGPEGYGYLWPLCKSLSERGHDVTVITAEHCDGNSSQEIEGVKVHFVEGASMGEGAVKEAVLDALESHHIDKPFDLVHSV